MYVYLIAAHFFSVGHWTDNDIDIKGRFDFANGSFYRGVYVYKCTNVFVCIYLSINTYLKEIKMHIQIYQVNLKRIGSMAKEYSHGNKYIH